MKASLTEFSLVNAIAGRRSRRFGVGMELPSGPLAYRSRAEPTPLSELERSILVAAATGVTGWNFGVPYGPDRPEEHAHYTQRFTGRTAPTAAGIGTPTLFTTDDSGTYFTNTRDALPDLPAEGAGSHEALDVMVESVRRHTERLSERRLDLPRPPRTCSNRTSGWQTRPVRPCSCRWPTPANRCSASWPWPWRMA